MKLVRPALAIALAAVLALPALGQTTQTSPGKPASPTIAPPAQPTPASRPSKSSSSTLVDINSASSADLDALPGIGHARADAIIKNRPYRGKDDLLSRGIIPPNVYKGISDKIIAKRS